MQRTSIQLALVLILGVVAGAFSHAVFLHSNAKIEQLREGGGFKYINPLLLCGFSNEEASAGFGPMRKKIAEAVIQNQHSQLADTIGVYFRDLNSGEWFGVNENEKFTPGSLLKLPVLMAYLRTAEADASLLTRQYAYTGKDDEVAQQNFKPDAPIVRGKQYSVSDLLQAMISGSDNNAAQVLVDHVNGEALDETYEVLRFSPPESPQAINFISPKTFSYFLRVLYNSSYLTREMSERALEMLSLDNFKYGIRSGTPNKVVVSEKFGERILPSVSGTVNELHDCGIVYYPNHPYLLCIMTRGKDLNRLPTVIKNIASGIFQEFNERYALGKQGSATN